MTDKGKIGKGREKAQKVMYLYRYISNTHGYVKKAYDSLVDLGQMYEGLGVRVDFEEQLDSLDALVTILDTQIKRLEDKVAKISLRD